MTSTVSVDPRILDYPEIVAVFFAYDFGFDALCTNTHLFPAAWQPLGGNELARKLLHERLEIHPRIREKVVEFTRRHFGATTVGVHVRQTDNMSRQMVAKGKGVSVPVLEVALEAFPKPQEGIDVEV